jgi:hypothetical protein
MVKVRAPLVQDPQRQDWVVNTTTFAGPLTKFQLDRAIEKGIDVLETHERDEWFRFDGRVVRDPHPEVPGYKDKEVTHVHHRGTSTPVRRASY